MKGTRQTPPVLGATGFSFQHSYRMHGFDANPNGTLKLTALLEYLQDVSTRHYLHVSEQGIPDAIWVVVGWHVHVHSELSGDQIVDVVTQPTYFRKFIAYRRYGVYDASGACVATAISQWAVIHRDTRKPYAIPGEMYQAFGIDPALQVREHVALPDGGAAESGVKTPYTPVFSDIDTNYHVNNIAYVRWAMDSLPLDFWDVRHIKDLNVSYRKEVHYGDTVHIETAVDAAQMQTHHRIVDASGELCVALTLVYEAR